MPMTPLEINPIILADTSAKDCLRLLAECHPAEIALKLPCPGGLLNFAVMTFKKRIRSWGSKSDEISLESYDEVQAAFIKELAITLAERYYLGDSAPTIRHTFLHTREVIEWSEANGHPDLFKSCEAHHAALIGYSAHLKERVNSELANNTARARLTAALSMNILAFPDNDYNYIPGITLFGYSKENVKHTQPPSDEEIEELIRPISGIFANIDKFLGTDRRLPYSFPIENDTVWFVHDYQAFMSETVMRDHMSTYGTPIWNAVKVKTLSRMKLSNENFHQALAHEMKELDQHRRLRFKSNNIYRKRNHILPEIATDRNIHDLCKLAHDCFIYLFILATSANLQPVQNIIWDEFSTIERGLQNQRVIKNRANHEVDISFSARFAKELDWYLSVRQILVGNHDFKFLFGHFAYGKPPKQMYGQYPNTALTLTQKFIFPQLNRINPRSLRAYHLAHKRDEHGIEASANTGGHTLRTSLESYSTGNPETNLQEATMFFTAIGDRSREFIATSKSISSGECASGSRNPVAFYEKPTILPDCKNFIGCLFCKYLFIHLNKEDIRKIYSMRYVIEQLRSIQISPIEYDEYWTPSLTRLNFIISRIKKIDSTLNELSLEIEKQVYEEEGLSPYWQHKLDVLVKIGVLA